MKLLLLGDVVGGKGCDFVRRHLPSLKKMYGVDLTIANGENSADGNGITPKSAADLFEAGVDVITTGNHAFRRRECYAEFDSNPYLLRPANYPDAAPGRGLCLVDFGYITVAVLNISGVVFLDNLDCPFLTADRLIAEAKAAGAGLIVCDFHAEATSEKRALGFYLDGRLTVLCGTHTHVQTADIQVLPGGTGYMTDLGMTGPVQSVLGVKAELAIAKQKDKLPVRFDYADSDYMLCGALFEVDHKTRQVTDCRAIHIGEEN